MVLEALLISPMYYATTGLLVCYGPPRALLLVAAQAIGGVALRVLPVLPPLRWGEWPVSGCTVASEVAGVAWVSKELRPKKEKN